MKNVITTAAVIGTLLFGTCALLFALATETDRERVMCLLDQLGRIFVYGRDHILTLSRAFL